MNAQPAQSTQTIELLKDALEQGQTHMNLYVAYEIRFIGSPVKFYKDQMMAEVVEIYKGRSIMTNVIGIAYGPHGEHLLIIRFHRSNVYVQEQDVLPIGEGVTMMIIKETKLYQTSGLSDGKETLSAETRVTVHNTATPTVVKVVTEKGHVGFVARPSVAMASTAKPAPAIEEKKPAVEKPAATKPAAKSKVVKKVAAKKAAPKKASVKKAAKK